MKKSQKTLSILKVEYLDSYRLKIFFADGKKQTVDFKHFLSRSTHREVRKYLKVKEFKKFRLENGDLMWGDFDLIFPIIDLYKNEIEKSSKLNVEAS